MSYKTGRGLTSCGFIVKNPTELSNFVYREYELTPARCGNIANAK